MHSIRKTTALTAVAVAMAVAPAAPTAPAAPAYKCAGSTKDIDDTSYDGPWPDNWKVTVKTCAARSGDTVYAYAEVRWDGASFHPVNDTTIFDGAKLRLQIKPSREGTDPVVAGRDFPEIVEAIGSDLADLISSARRQNQGVNCWVA